MPPLEHTRKLYCTPKFIAAPPCSLSKHVSRYDILILYNPWLRFLSCSLNGLVKMPIAARQFEHEPVSVAPLKWLHGCFHARNLVPSRSCAPHPSESWRCRTCPVPATPRIAVVWTRRTSASNLARCTVWRLTVVFISLVQGCYRDFTQ